MYFLIDFFFFLLNFKQLAKETAGSQDLKWRVISLLLHLTFPFLSLSQSHTLINNARDISE